MRFALVGVAGAENETGWSDGDIPAEHAIRGFHGVTLLLGKAAPTAAILTDVLGFREVGARGRAARAIAATRRSADMSICARSAISRAAGIGRGSVHHVAFRAPDDAAQAAMAEEAGRASGMHVDRAEGPQLLPLDLLPRAERRAVRDRDRSSRASRSTSRRRASGSALKLPRFLEPRRAELEAKLPPLARGGVMADVPPRARRCHSRAAPPPCCCTGAAATPKTCSRSRRSSASDDIAYLAPEAPDDSWYPYSFLAPLEQNEPHLSDALATVGATLEQLAREGFPPERVALIGFSQGGCLALEYVARNAKRYGAVAGLSAGLIGPPGTPRDYAGSLAGTPVFLGCSDVDAHIPLARVHEIARRAREAGRRR